jgi:hypothetical protein
VAFTTIPAAGAKLRASVLNSLITELRPIEAVKTGDTSRTSDASLTDDGDLTVALPANTTWEYTLVLLLNSAANAAGDFNAQMTFPANATHMYGAVGLDDALASGQVTDLRSEAGTRDTTSPSATFQFGTSTTVTTAVVTGRIELGATAGSLTLQWGQLASNANATTVQDGSYLVAHRVS